MTTKTITLATWKSYAIVALPTATTGTVRQDAQGARWVWVSSGKRVTIRKV